MGCVSTGIVILDEDGHDPARLVVEVYDNPQPAPRIERVLAVEALTAWPRIVFMMVRSFDGSEDRLDVVEQPVSVAASEV